MANYKAYDPETAKKMNEAYRIRLEEYVEKKYKKVDQSWYAGVDKEHTYEFGENHILVLKAPANSVHARSLWYEYDLSDTKEPVAKGDIFAFVAREKGIENNDQNRKDIILPEVVKALGEYTQKQLSTTTVKLNKFKVEELEKKKSLTPEEKAFVHRLDTTNNKRTVVPMVYNVIHQIEQSGTLFGPEPKPMPILVELGKMGKDDKSSLRYKNEKSPGAEKFYMTGMQYIQSLMDDRIPDKRYVYASELNGKYSWFTRGVTQGTTTRTEADGTQKTVKMQGKAYLWVFHPQNPKDKDQNVDGYMTIRYVVPFNQLICDGIGITAYNYAKTQNNEEVAKKAIEHFPGCFTDKDSRVAEALKQELIKDPVKAFRRAVELHSGVAQIQKVPGLYLLQREMIVDYGLRYCGYKGEIQIPEKDRGILCDYMKKDVVGYEKSVVSKDQKNQKKFVRIRQSPCKYFRMSVVNMDKKIKHMLGLGKILTSEEIHKQSAKRVRNAFDEISIVMETAYYNRKKAFYPQGAGSGLRKIEGEEAYKLLGDMLLKDKEMYDNEKHMSWNPENAQKYSEEEKKEVRLQLNLGNGREPMHLVFRPGQLHMKNATNVNDAILALQTRQEYDNAYNRNTIERNYKLYVDQMQFDHPGFTPKKDEKKEFVVHEREIFNKKLEDLRNRLSVFTSDEQTYLNANKEVAEEMHRKADTFFYALPKESSRELILEGFESKNVIRISHANQINKENDDFYIVELRNQLDPLVRNGEVARDKDGHAYFYDASPAHRAFTERMEVVPWLSDKAMQHANDFNEKFAVNLKVDGEDITIKGDSGREFLVSQMAADRDSFECEATKQLRREMDLPPYSIDVSYDGQSLFKESGHYGELKLGNFKSVEEMISSRRSSMTQEETQKLDEVLKAEMVAKKYSEVKADEDYLKTCEKVSQKEIDAVRKKPMKSYEAAYPEPGEELSRVEVLQRDAKVNHIDEEEAVMTYVAAELAKDAKAQKVNNPMQSVTETLKTAYPDREDLVDKVMKDEKVQKMTKSKGIHRSSSGLSRSSRSV